MEPGLFTPLSLTRAGIVCYNGGKEPSERLV